MIEPDLSGPTAPPRSNGELVFDEPWQAEVFGMTLTLLERDERSWDDFRPHLVAAIAATPGAPYYEALVAALEDYLRTRHP